MKWNWYFCFFLWMIHKILLNDYKELSVVFAVCDFDQINRITTIAWVFDRQIIVSPVSIVTASKSKYCPITYDNKKNLYELICRTNAQTKPNRGMQTCAQMKYGLCYRNSYFYDIIKWFFINHCSNRINWMFVVSDEKCLFCSQCSKPCGSFIFIS